VKKRSIYEPTVTGLFQHAVVSRKQELRYNSEPGVQYHTGLAQGILLTAKHILGENNPIVRQMQATWDEMTRPTAPPEAREAGDERGPAT